MKKTKNKKQKQNQKQNRTKQKQKQKQKTKLTNFKNPYCSQALIKHSSVFDIFCWFYHRKKP